MDIKGKAINPMDRIPNKRREFKGESSSKRRRLDGPSTRSRGASSSDSQRISVRRSKRLANLDNEDGQKRATILSWLLDSTIVPENPTVYYMAEVGFKQGTIKRNGIFCTCCKCIFTIKDFQVHAGGVIGDNPYHKIKVDGIRHDGNLTPLSECMELGLQNPDQPAYHGLKRITSKGSGGDTHDDACVICADGGEMICCEQCNSTYHEKCLNMQTVPEDPFYCPYCVCKFCGMRTFEKDADCLTCSLCSKQYHCKCSEDPAVSREGSLKVFCERRCREVYENLEQQIGVKHELEDGLSWTLLHRSDKSKGSYEVDEERRLEVYCKLAVAFGMMTACFEPIKDRHTRINMIHNVVYNCGSCYRRLNFCGFLTAVLEKSDEIIAAASIRFHGTKLAEMPFIATAEPHRNKGMCGILLREVESVLHSLRVRTLVIPSSSETVNVWQKKYGFNHVDEDTEKDIMKLNTLTFHDCSRMQKAIPGIDLNLDPLPE